MEGAIGSIPGSGRPLGEGLQSKGSQRIGHNLVIKHIKFIMMTFEAM